MPGEEEGRPVAHTLGTVLEVDTELRIRNLLAVGFHSYSSNFLHRHHRRRLRHRRKSLGQRQIVLRSRGTAYSKEVRSIWV